MQGVQLDARSHGAHSWLGKEVAPVSWVIPSQPLRNEFLDLFAEELLPFVPKQFLDLCVDEDNLSVLVYNYDSIRRGLEKATESGLRALLPADVDSGRDNVGWSLFDSRKDCG
jgi:hypothetical protein